MQTQVELNAAQAAIYTRTNLSRAFQDFDDTDIGGIYLRGDDCLVVRRDGSEQAYNRELIKASFNTYTHRLKDFFSYLGPNYRGPSVWHNNAYILFKGWNYSHALGHLTSNAKLQAHWADKFIHVSEQQKLYPPPPVRQTDLAIWLHQMECGIRIGPLILTATWKVNKPPVVGEPWCSCGSYQRQLSNVSDFASEITGFKPWCIHLSWFNKYRELLCKRTEARNASPSGTPEKCVAWWYAPPADHISDGRFVLLYTNSGAQSPLSHWRTYKPKEIFTQHDAWDLFFNMMEAGYVPFPGTALPQLKSAIKKQ
jgi:hypothetical protein